MPQGADWAERLLQASIYGYLHLVAGRATPVGRWLRPTKEHVRREVHGEITGDVIDSPWVEAHHRRRRPQLANKGHGFFKVQAPNGDNVDDTIVGEVFGRIERRRRSMGRNDDAQLGAPRPKSIGCPAAAGAGDLGGGDWDKGGTRSRARPKLRSRRAPRRPSRSQDHDGAPPHKPPPGWLRCRTVPF